MGQKGVKVGRWDKGSKSGTVPGYGVGPEDLAKG